MSGESGGDPAQDPARRRFLAIQALRWAGLALVLVGLLALYRRISLPVEAAYLLVPLGLVLALVLPGVLARRWRTRP